MHRNCKSFMLFLFQHFVFLASPLAPLQMRGVGNKKPRDSGGACILSDFVFN